MITILGLGPGNPDLWTMEARAVLDEASQVYLRTREHLAVAALPAHLQVHSFDSIYEAHDDFETIYERIASEILKLAEVGSPVYAVPGHPLVGEVTVRKILARAREREIPVRLVAGQSFMEASYVELELDPLAQGMQIVDALDLAREHFPRLDTDRPALVGQVYSRAVAGEVKLTLLVNYPPGHPVQILDAAGTPAARRTTRPLAELDHERDFGLLTSLYIPPVDRPGSPLTLAELMAHLRAPEGCPWDREQTPQSLRSALLEETNEVLQALDREDMPNLREELGDLLLHVLFQTEMASEAGEFTLAEVGAGLAEKLIRRHPHVFGKAKVKSAGQVVENWNRIKEAEKAQAGETVKGIESGIPAGLPALARAQKIFKRAKRAGNAEAPKQVMTTNWARRKDRERELGRALFAIAAAAAELELDAESALRRFTGEFVEGIQSPVARVKARPRKGAVKKKAQRT